MAVREAPAKLRKHDFCPGCGHGIITRLLYEVFEELGCDNNNCVVLGVGCSCIVKTMTGGDRLQSAHGRASAEATGIKRYRPKMVVVSYQGDGDAGVIGLSETLNAAYRNENITLIMVNNTNFGMTGGQMGWTTMPGQKTVTSIHGRDCEKTGYPLHLPEMIANEFRVAYAARGAVHNLKHINQTKGMIKKAIQAQLNGEGYSVVEVLSQCPTNWGIEPLKCIDRVEELIGEYPIGELKTKGREEKK